MRQRKRKSKSKRKEEGEKENDRIAKQRTSQITEKVK